MSTFQTNDKVVCIDATPLPLHCDRHFTTLDFSFPGGFIREGSIYCVTSVGTGSDSPAAIRLAGKPIFLHDIEVAWSGQRFRQVKRQRQQARRSAEQSRPPKATR